MGFLNPEEVNAAARKAARMLGKSGAAGHVAPARVIPYDIRNTTEEDILEDTYVKISDELIDLTAVSEITTSDRSGGTVTMTKDMFSVRTVNEYRKVLDCTVEGETIPVLMVQDFSTHEWADTPIAKEQTGTYVMTLLDFGNIKLAETIHPIDKKYLPGVCLPVVELGTLPFDGSSTITDETVINALDNSETPLLAHFDANGVATTYALVSKCASSDIVMWLGSFVLEGVTILRLQKTDGQWQTSFAIVG